MECYIYFCVIKQRLLRNNILIYMKRLYLAKPFVKWVGGKTQLLNDIRKTLPQDLSLRDEVVYVEPFVGGGAVLSK